MPKPRRFTNAEIDAIAAIREDWCPPWEDWQALLAQAKAANPPNPPPATMRQREFPQQEGESHDHRAI
jgi:hypothetical protein